MGRPKVKICGITSLEDARMCVDVGADMLGFNFYKESPRYITREKAQEIMEGLGDTEVETVGVFVDEPISDIVVCPVACMLDYAQLHGDESAFMCNELRAQGVKVIKAIRVRENNPEDWKNYTDFNVNALLLDSFVKDLYGGTGATFVWSIVQEYKRLDKPLILSGGLTPDNIAEAVRKTLPYGVDVCSGVESMPGKKDEARVRAFMENIT